MALDRRRKYDILWKLVDEREQRHMEDTRNMPSIRMGFKTMILPDTLKIISESAFENFVSLEEVELLKIWNN